ncbi:hypothetical protein CJU90_3983 [Yarrowia sp. C11]|nr:hypothetical protein CJU90_3983 [Yarrowia sp. C11]
MSETTETPTVDPSPQPSCVPGLEGSWSQAHNAFVCDFVEANMDMTSKDQALEIRFQLGRRFGFVFLHSEVEFWRDYQARAKQGLALA